MNEKKIEREGNDFDVTLCIQREHKGRAVLDSDVIVYTQREALFVETLLIFLELFIEARCRTKRGGGCF